MKPRRKLLYIVLLLLLGAAFLWLRSLEEKIEREEMKRAEPAPQTGREVERPGEPGTPEPTATPTASPVGEPIALDPPGLDTLREEVAEDPHQTPPSVLAFSNRLAKEMSRAFRSREYARRLYAGLEDCADEPSGASPLAVRTICTVNAARLAGKYPGDFERSLEDLLRRIPRRQRDLFEAMAPKPESGPKSGPVSEAKPAEDGARGTRAQQ